MELFCVCVLIMVFFGNFDVTLDSFRRFSVKNPGK